MTRGRRRTVSKPPHHRTALLDIARVLTGTLHPDDLFRAIYEELSHILVLDHFHIALYEDSSDTATVVFSVDRGEARPLPLQHAGTASEAVRQRRPVLRRGNGIEDVASTPPGPDGRGPAYSAVTAPMRRGSRILGVIGARSDRRDAYTADDLELLAAVADLAAVALENSHHIAEAERRRREAERLEEIGRALTASLELPQVLERVVAAAIDLAEADGATLWLVKDDGTVEVSMTAGEVAFPPGTTLTVPPGLHRHLVQERRSLIIQEPQEHPLLTPELRAALRIESAILVPLVVDDRVLGALSMGHHSSRSYRAEDLRLLERLSLQAAIAVANARLHEQIRQLSLTDPLTGLPNRRHLERTMEREFAAARRGRPLTVVLFDLDRFKEYNDTSGHQAGDEALRSFGRILGAACRAVDLAARYGGDEFISILAGADSQGGLQHAVRVAETAASHPMLRTIGVSAGVASYVPIMTGPEDLIRAADCDLYLRKAERASLSRSH